MKTCRDKYKLFLEKILGRIMSDDCLTKPGMFVYPVVKGFMEWINSIDAGLVDFSIINCDIAGEALKRFLESFEPPIIGKDIPELYSIDGKLV